MWNFGDIGRSKTEMEMGAPAHITAAKSSELSSGHLNNALLPNSSFHSSKNSSFRFFSFPSLMLLTFRFNYNLDNF